MRHITFVLALAATCLAFGQAAPPIGNTFSRVPKNAAGDVYAVVTGALADNGQGLIYVEDDMVPKVVSIDAGMNTGNELVLQNQPFDALMWNGVTGFVVDGALHCLLHTNTKKSTEYAIAKVDAHGTPALNGLRRVASSEITYKNDPTTTLPYRPQPDPILFSKGLLFANTERIIAAPDGQHYLLNHHTVDVKGNKRFWFAYLDKEFTELWSGTATLPYADETSRIHQISVSNDGTIHLLAYAFPCGSEERKGDKLCHELHLTTLTDRGKTVSDVLVDKDFVSSARLCEREDGKVSMALRYGALTGQPGVVLTFDPADPKLKATPLVDQRIPSIRKTKLLAYGAVEVGSKKAAMSRTAKVPDEIVALLPTWDGLVVVETFLETAFEIPVGEAIAIRRLAGDVRTSFIAANDSIKWQHIAQRAFMTTAGQSYEGVDVHLAANGLTLLYDHTPKGIGAILRSGSAPQEEESTDKKSRKDKAPGLAESGVLKAITIDAQGAVVAEGTALIPPDGFMPCPQGAVRGASGKVYVVKNFDRKNSYSFALIDASAVGK
ncbi:MAG: hypothetical protein KF797_08190 [Flavobacteriales bacterium]|nr:hypothetical protein [Flavobacteriales bacterium]